MKNLKLHWHRLRNSATVKIDGLTVCTEKDAMPKSVRSSLFKGTHELHERALVAKYLDTSDRVLEIGAATGLVSLGCVKQCGEGNVISYEANPVMEELIRKNFKLNNFKPNLVMKAITLDGSDISFFASDNIYSSSMIDRSDTLPGKNITVPSDPIDAVIARFKPSAIVIDVEGAEIELLGHANLRSITKMIVEMHPHITGRESVTTLEDHFCAQGFRKIETAHKTAYYQKSQS